MSYRKRIVSSNKNWFEFIDEISKDSRLISPSFILSNISNLPTVPHREKYSLLLLDGKFGLFCYVPQISVISVACSYLVGETIGLEIISWKKTDFWWNRFSTLVVLYGESCQSSDFRLASQFARQSIVKISKARTLNEFDSIRESIDEYSFRKRWNIVQ